MNLFTARLTGKMLSTDAFEKEMAAMIERVNRWRRIEKSPELAEYLAWGKFGINADCGIAFHAKNTPVVVAFDFRPGYGLGFKNSNAVFMHFFDWKLGLAVRYAF